MYLKIAASILGLVIVSFFVGRFSAPKPLPEVRTIEVIKEVVVESKKKTNTKVIVVKEPGGKETTTSETNETTDTVSKEVIKEKEKVIALKNDWNVSALVGIKNFNRESIVYGLEVQRRILGDIHVGVWGLTDKTVGLNVGFSF